MNPHSKLVTEKSATDPYSGSSLVPMLVAGLVLTFVGMIAVAMFS